MSGLMREPDVRADSGANQKMSGLILEQVKMVNLDQSRRRSIDCQVCARDVILSQRSGSMCRRIPELVRTCRQILEQVKMLSCPVGSKGLRREPDVRADSGANQK